MRASPKNLFRLKPALLIAAVLTLLARAAAADEGYYNFEMTEKAAPEKVQGAAEEARAEAEESAPQQQRHIVTSVRKCFDEIGAEAALEIRRTSLTPYADCQKRLRQKLKSQAKEDDDKEAERAETPRNYVRVLEKEEPAAGEDAEKGEKTSSSKGKKKPAR